MKKLFLSLFFVLGLAGCASVQPTHPVSSKNWVLQGKLAVQYQDHAETASLYWRQTGKDYYIRVFGPLGLGAVQLNGNPQGVTLIDNKGVAHQAKSPDLLLEQFLGYPLPVNNLVYWVRGIHTRHMSGWHIQYLSYYQNGLPKLMTLSRQNIKLRIFIDSFTAPA